VYITATNTNPGTFLGGTWARIGQGRTLIGEGTLGSDTYAAGATGGAARVTLTTSEMPAHNHGGATGVTSTDHVHTGTTSGSGNHQHTYERFTGGTSGSVATASIDGNGPMRYNDYGNSGWAGDHSHSFTTSNPSQTHTHPVSNEGGGAAHENRMPYLTVYFWQRTA
jgi:microcystin-dependent protein